ncbi:MAG: fluoride efflux transporter CrcB [Lentisphaerota bacterium]
MMKELAPFFYVGTGGFLGAVTRYGLTLMSQRFVVVLPMGTLLSNLLGCLAIGLIMGLAADTQIIRPEMRLLLATGFCGGFTTMSSMVYELSQFIRDHEFFYATGYFGITIAGCLICFYLGLLLTRLLH